jgi:hypothetical protein
VLSEASAAGIAWDAPPEKSEGGATMEHYSMEKWIDFARGVVGPQDKAAMESHLKSGCKQCSRTLDLWKHVYEAARFGQASEPPDSAVRSVKANFALYGPRREKRGAKAIAKLLFDSTLGPLPVGVRSTASPARQLLFGIGTYRIDLRMEPQIDSQKVAVIGQVLHSADPLNGLGALPVSIVKGRKVVAETITSQFGEFNLECDLEGGFQLRVKLPAEELQFALVEPLLPPGRLLPLSADSKRVSRIPRRRKRHTRGPY